MVYIFSMKLFSFLPYIRLLIELNKLAEWLIIFSRTCVTSIIFKILIRGVCMQKTKMIFTIGPASDNEETLKKFIEIGMSAARLNFSHGTHESHKEKIELIQRLSKEMDSATAIVLDIKGPKIRTHNFINDGVTLNDGDNFAFVCGEEILGDEKRCSISYDVLYEDIKVGGKILVDDGLLKLKLLALKVKLSTQKL